MKKKFFAPTYGLGCDGILCLGVIFSRPDFVLEHSITEGEWRVLGVPVASGVVALTAVVAFFVVVGALVVADGLLRRLSGWAALP